MNNDALAIIVISILFLGEYSNRAPFKTPILQNAKLKINLKVNRVGYEKYVNYEEADKGLAFSGQAEMELASFMFDPCTLIPLFQDMLLQQTNIIELIEQHGESLATSDELSVINYLTGNEYSRVWMTTVEGEFEDYPAFPFFRVELGGVVYDSSGMGMGELSLFYFWWLVRYMENVEGGKVLFVEEPESFLPPASQERLTNILAKVVAGLGITLMLATHSEHILKRIPSSRVHLILRTDEGIKSFSIVDGMASHLESLGLVSPKIGMLFLEDVGGILFAKALFNSSTEFSINSFYYHKSGSDGHVSTDLSRLAFPHKGFKFVGLYDGDCRGNKAALNKGGEYFFLPTNLAPDELMAAYFKSKPTAFLAAKLMVSEVKVSQAKAFAAGSDFHDYFHNVNRVFGWDFNRLFSVVCEMWIDEHPQELEDFLIEAKIAIFGR
ncbi:AAA family ATPase [Pseudomonas sp. PDM27]|uniref:AAA family ATPase n=1 Tax=Pseudomonas sp. PDM27 TaxID=2854769 RepID=UPI001C47D874|nr:AAA family ATPase [Pseudomonas sp. PDM27]MBV7567626.1 AAA family ATPase [Pseudomonas sp. PDM27]